MASNIMARLDLLKLGALLAANGHCIGAAAMEKAAGRQVNGAGNFADHFHRFHQRLFTTVGTAESSIFVYGWLMRSNKSCLERTPQRAQVHNAKTVADMLDDG